MSKMKIYPKMKRLIAGVLVPVSLVGSLTSCKNRKSVSTEVLLPNKIIEDTKVNIDSFLTVLRTTSEFIELHTIAKEYIDIDISLPEDIQDRYILISIKGIQDEVIESERFYQLCNALLKRIPDDYSINLFLDNYHNQIDFTKLTLDGQGKIDLFLLNSKSVNVRGMEDHLKTIIPSNSSIDHLENVAPYLEKNNATISFDCCLKGDQTVASHIQTFFGDTYVKVGKIFIRSMDAEEAPELNAIISKLKCSRIDLDYVYGDIILDPDIQEIWITNSGTDLQISAGDQAHVSYMSWAQLFGDDLNSPLVRGLSNVETLDLYFGLGPNYPYDIMKATDADVHIRVTKDECVILSEHTDWDIAATKDEEGKWDIEFQFDEPELDKQKTR